MITIAMQGRIQFEAELCDVTPEDIAEYRQRGYWISPKLFSDQAILRLRAAHERLWRGDHDGGATPPQYGVTKVNLEGAALRQQCNGFWLNDEIRQVVAGPVLGAIGAQLMGVRSVRLWHDQVIYKPSVDPSVANPAGSVGWHQDYGYWHASDTQNMCTAWLALQDTDLSNGGMRTIVGSHKWGLIPESDTFYEPDLEKLRARYSAYGEWIDEPCILRAGQASFHHALSLHGSGPNFSGSPRLSVVSHMMPGDTCYSSAAQWHPNVVFLGPSPKKGQPFAGSYWPEMFG